MKVSYLVESNDIGVEIDRIIDNGVQLFCLRDKAKPVPLTIKGKKRIENDTFLFLDHPKKEICPQKKCFFFYHVKGQPMRCFHCIPQRQVNSLLALNYPEEIFEIQRRKYPRIKACYGSWVSFTLAKKQKIFRGKTIDVSMEGAKISGDFPLQISAGETVTPLTMTLFSHSATKGEIHVQIPEAKVVRVVGTKHGTKEFSIHFTLPDKLQKPLARYVDMRELEEMDNK